MAASSDSPRRPWSASARHIGGVVGGSGNPRTTRALKRRNPPRRIGLQPRQRREPPRVEQSRQRVRVVRLPSGDPVYGVERHDLRVGHHGREPAGEIGPDHATGGVGEAGAKQLPGRPRAIVAAAAEPIHVRCECGGELGRQARERSAVGRVGPQQVRASGGPPRCQITAPHGGSGRRPRLGAQEHVVRAGLHAELRSPTLADPRASRPEVPGDSYRVARQDPGTVPREGALRDQGRGAPGPERGRDLLAPGRLRPGGDEHHGVDRRRECTPR